MHAGTSAHAAVDVYRAATAHIWNCGINANVQDAIALRAASAGTVVRLHFCTVKGSIHVGPSTQLEGANHLPVNQPQGPPEEQEMAARFAALVGRAMAALEGVQGAAGVLPLPA
jgi:hypothetical protein